MYEPLRHGQGMHRKFIAKSTEGVRRRVLFNWPDLSEIGSLLAGQRRSAAKFEVGLLTLTNAKRIILANTCKRDT